MIVDFTIENFRSIKERQTFSLLADGTPNHLPDNIVYPADKKIGVLRTAGIYGANASGKSNVLLAFEALRYIVYHSGELKDGEMIPSYEPYLLTDSTKDAPVTFEIEFYALENTRFLYCVSFTSNCIVSESLDFFPSHQKANLFKRNENSSWKDISFGPRYKGGRKKHAFFANNSYLSKAGNSADSPAIIQIAYNYLLFNLFYDLPGNKSNYFRWNENPYITHKLAKLLAKVDTGIIDMEYKESDVSYKNLPKNMPVEIKNQIVKINRKIPLFIHKAEDNSLVNFTEYMESSGTMKLFNTLPLIIQTLNYGSVLLLDELETSFHPHIAELIIKLFNDPAVNTKNAQLIFSTHNINLMSPDLLRRDQVWFTEKKNGATSLFSLIEFDKSTVKTDSPYSRWYDEGRFGAIPKIDYGAIASILSNEQPDNAKTKKKRHKAG